MGCGCGVVEKFLSRTKNTQKYFQKHFHGPDYILELYNPAKAKKNADFWPKMAIMQKFLWQKIGVAGEGWPKVFRSGPKIPKSTSKTKFMVLTTFWDSVAR